MVELTRGAALGAAVTLVLCACDGGGNGGDAGSATDSGSGAVDAGGPRDAGPPPSSSPAQIPWRDDSVPPLQWECPPGWRSVDLEGVSVCDPYPEGGANLDCSPGEVHFPGDPACSRLGPACPAEEGGFPDVSDLTGRVLYARSGANAPPDGSMDAPFPTLEEALAAATTGTTVVLAAGLYPIADVWPDGVSLRGACSEGTTLVAKQGAPTDAVLDLSALSEPVRLENVLVSVPPSEERLAVRTEGVTTQATFESVEVIGAGLELQGEIQARNLYVHDTVGEGIRIFALQGPVTVERVVIERATGDGVVMLGGGSVSDATIRDVRPIDSPGIGRARGGGITTSVSMPEMPAQRIERALIEGCSAFGIRAVGFSSPFATDIVIRDTASTDTEGGLGVEVANSSAIRLERALIQRNSATGILLAEAADTDNILRDVVVEDTVSDEALGTRGRGIQVTNGASLELMRAVLRRNEDIALSLLGSGCSAAIEDVAILDTTPFRGDSSFGRGVTVQDGSTLVGRRVLVRQSRGAGFFIDNRRGIDIPTGVVAELTDIDVINVDVAECRPDCNEPAGVGIVSFGGVTRVERFGIRGSGACAVQLGGVGEADLTEGLVRETPIGVCLADDAYDVTRLIDRVFYVDVEPRFQAAEFRIPDPAPF